MKRLAVDAVWPAWIHDYGQKEIGLGGLQPGLNVVFAPNSSGKSTLAKALLFALNPKSCDSAATIDIAGCFVSDDGSAPESFKTTVRRNAVPPFGMSAGRLQDYFLDVVKLLRGMKEEDRSFVGEHLSGGISLDVPKYPSMRNVAGDALAASRELQKLATAAEELRETEASVPKLRRRVAEAQEARDLSQEVQKAIVWRELRGKLEACERDVTELEREHPGTSNQTEEAEGRVRNAEALLRTKEKDARTALESLKEVVPTGEYPPKSLLLEHRAALNNSLGVLTALKGERRQIVASLATSRNQTAATLRSLREFAPEVEALELEALTNEDLAGLLDLAHRYDKVRSERCEKEGYRRAAIQWELTHQGARDARQEDLDTAKKSLLRWLRSEPNLKPKSPAFLLIGLAATVLSVLPLPEAVRILTAVAAGAVFVAGFVVFGRRAVPINEERKKAEAELAQSTFKPTTFDSTGVAEKLEGVLRLSAEKGALDHLWAQYGSTTVGEPNLAEWVDHWKLKAEDPFRMELLAKRYDDWRMAVKAASEALSKLQTNDEQITEQRTKLRDVYCEYDYDPSGVADLEEAADAFQQWFERAARHRQAEQVRKDAFCDLLRKLDDCGVTDAGDLEARIAVMVARSEIAKKYLEKSSGRQTLEDRVRECSVDWKKLKKAAAGHPSPRMSIESLLTLKDECDLLAEALSGLQDELNKAITDVKAFEQTHSVQDKERAYGEAMTRLESKCAVYQAQAVHHRVGNLLRDKLATAVPPLILRANEHLARFTSDRLTLRGTQAFDPNGLGSVEVLDQDRKLVQTFAKLNTSAKVHVLLALKIALIEEHETQTGEGALLFPLVVDELMAVSDQSASRALAGALALASRERQVIAFTNQPDDVRILEEAAKERGVGIYVCRIANRRDEIPSGQPILLAEAPRLAGPRSLHLYTPIWRHSPGAVLEGGNDEAVTVEEALEAMGEAEPYWRRYVEILESLRSYVADRRKELTVSAIQTEPWVTGTFGDRLRQLATRSGGDGRLFLRWLYDRGVPEDTSGESINLKGFRDASIEGAERFLVAGTYLEEVAYDDLMLEARSLIQPGDNPLTAVLAVERLKQFCLSAALSSA